MRIKPTAGLRSWLFQLLIKSVRIFSGGLGPSELLVVHSRDGKTSEKLSWGQHCSLVLVCEMA